MDSVGAIIRMVLILVTAMALTGRAGPLCAEAPEILSAGSTIAWTAADDRPSRNAGKAFRDLSTGCAASCAMPATPEMAVSVIPPADVPASGWHRIVLVGHNDGPAPPPPRA